MPVDTASHIGDFNTALPTSADPVSEGDDNHRHIKTVLKADFANITGAVTLSHTQINALPADIALVQSNLDSESARLDAADLSLQSTLNTTISDGDDVVRGEFAAADTTTYNNAVADAGTNADAKDITAIDGLRGEVTPGKTVLANFDAIAADVADLAQHKIDQLAIDGDQNALIVGLQDAIDNLTGSDTNLPAAETYTNEQVNLLRGQATHDNTVTVKANFDKIATNTSDIATNTSDIATNAANISTNTSNISTNTSNISNHEGRISTLEGAGGEVTMQLVVDTIYPVGSYVFMAYSYDLPSILTQYGTWVSSNTRAVMYMNASKNDQISNGYRFVGPQLTSTGGQPSQSVLDSVPVRAFLRTS